MSMKNSNDAIGNRTRDFPVCIAVPQPTALPRTPIFKGPGYIECTFHTFFQYIFFNLRWLCKKIHNEWLKNYWYTPNIKKITRHWIFTYMDLAIYQDRKPLMKHVACYNIGNRRTIFEHRPKPVLSNVYLTGCLPEVYLFVGKQRRIFHQTTKTNLYSQSMFSLSTYLNSLSYSSYFWHPINFNWRVRPAGCLVN
jgi:hypothetical protein